MPDEPESEAQELKGHIVRVDYGVIRLDGPWAWCTRQPQPDPQQIPPEVRQYVELNRN